MKYHVYPKTDLFCTKNERHVFLAGPDDPCQCGEFKDLWAPPNLRDIEEKDRVSMRNLSRPQPATGQSDSSRASERPDHSSGKG